MKVIAVILIILCILLIISYIKHRIQLGKEAPLRSPLGSLVKVNGHNMSLYAEGTGDKIIVFMSGSGTSSPILDFKSLYSLLSNDYKIVVVEKFGYGFSDIIKENRDIDTVLNQTRAALIAEGLNGPYVLCPHSMSGLEALYWAQQYPEEVDAIVGLDMAVPQYYEIMKINIPATMFVQQTIQYAARLGITRLLPNISELDAIKYGTLTEEEKAIYRAVFYNRTATATMIEEVKSVKENASTVERGGVPQVPMLLFISDGSGGTGFDMETWRQIPKDYIAKVPNGKYVELNCPHYVHNYEFEKISEEIKGFLSGIV